MIDYVFGVDEKISLGSHHCTTFVKWWKPAKKVGKECQW